MSTPDAGNRLLSYVDALVEATAQEMERDERVFVFGLDVDDHKAIMGSTRGLPERFGPSRVFGTPLSEDAMTGVAIGAAMAGMRPIHVHIRMDFTLLAMNQMVNNAAKIHYMTDGQYKVPMVMRSAIGRSWGQGAQHSQGLHGMFAHIPGLKVVAPSNAYDAKGCLIAAIRDDNPVVFVEHRLLYGTEAYVPEAPYEVAPGRARVVAEGSDITLVAISNMVPECLRARELLAEVGISAEVIDPIWLAPLDIDTMVASVARTRRVISVDNAWTTGGSGAEIAIAIVERLAPDCSVAIKRIGFAPTPCPTTPALEKHFYPNPASIAEAAYAMVRPNDKPWRPTEEQAQLAYQMKFRGPF